MKRILSLMTATILLVTCLISGLVLPTSATSSAANLVTNGDFESGTAGWDACASMIKAGVGYNGSVGLEFDTHGYSAAATYVKAGGFDLEPNSTYRATYRCYGTPVCLYIAGTTADVSKFNRTTATVDYNGRWTTWVVYLTTGAEPELSSLAFKRTSATTSGSTFIDDLTFEKMEDDTNQIVGGDFESCSAQWLNAIEKANGMEYVADPIAGAGNQVAHFTKDTGAAYIPFLRMVPGRRYQLSFRHYGSSLGYQIDKTVGVDTSGVTLGKWNYTGDHTEWTDVTFVFDTFNQQGVATNGAYQFCIGKAAGAYIDDVVLKQLPATVGLSLNASELSLRTGKRYQLTYTRTPADAVLQGGELTWASSNPDAVSVTASGELFVRGNAGQSAVITLSNPCMSASCTVTIPTNDPVVDAFFKDSGIGDYTVTAKNYDAIIGAESRYEALTDAQREYIAELLPVGRNYPDLLAKAKEVQPQMAAEFAKYYACDADGNAYTAVTFDNCLWIASAAEEWNAMSASTKALIDDAVKAASGMTFTAMFDAATETVPVTNPNDRPGGAGAAAPEEDEDPQPDEEEIPADTPENTVEPGVITPSGSTNITLSNAWLDEVTIPEYAYSIAIVGDTQVVTDRSPAGLKTLYDWILANKESKKMQFVAGLGDITEHNTDDEWAVAAEQIMRLKGEIPFSVVYGNHDVFNGSTALYNQYLSAEAMFGHLDADRYGLFEEGKADNAYQLFEVGDIKYVMITLEFGPRPAVLAWAGEVCDAYPDRNVIITTHAYLDGLGYVMDLNHSGSPHLKGGYETTYGTTIWEDLVNTHDNIVLTFSGHVTADKAMTRQEIGKYGQVVTQTVSNPQTIDDQSMLTGMVTMLYFSEDGTQMTVSDYSTIQGKYYGQPYTVTVDKAQHRHKASTDVWSADAASHWFACACGAKAEEVPHAFTAWDTTETDGVQSRVCAICEYEQLLTVPSLFTEVELHRAANRTWQHNEEEHWLDCECGDETVHNAEHNWTQWEKTGTASSTSIFKEDVNATLSSYIEGGPITNAVGLLNPNENDLAKTLGDTFAAELKANIIGDFEKDGDKMVHVSSFTIIDDVVYMTYYANTATAAESAAHQEARLAYCPIDDPDDLTVLTVQKVGDKIEGQEVTMLYDTILMNKDEDEIYIMWTAKTSQYYRFYSVFDVATGTMGPIRVNRFKVGDVTNDFSISGVRKALKANGMDTRWMLSDIGIMQKLSTRVENGVTWYYTGAYIWQFNCIIKSTDFITWEFVAAPDFDNQSEYENATYVLGDKVYYFVRQYDGNSTDVKCTTGFLTYYDLVEKTWAAPLEITDCQSRSDFIYYGGELYLMHAPKNRNGIGFVRVDQEDLANSEAVVVADMQSSCFYPFAKVYGDEMYISYTVNRQHIRLSKVDLTNYFESDGTPSEGPVGDVIPEPTVEEVVDDLDVWERFCPCGASEYETLPMDMPAETDSDKNLIFGIVDQSFAVGGGKPTTATATVPVELKSGKRYALRFVAKGAAGKVSLTDVSGVTVTTVGTDDWRIYQYLFTPAADMTAINLKVQLTGATRMDVVNVQILEAPQDGTFNLFPGADMSIENIVFDTATSGLGPVYADDQATHVQDPTDPNNTVLKLQKGKAAYFQLNNALKGLQLNSDMYLEITYRRTGTAMRVRKNWGANFPTYIGNQEAATASGVWETFTHYVAPGSSDLVYGSGAWGSQHISFYAPNGDVYIDDIIIREVPRVQGVSFKEETVKVDAASGAHDISDQLVITPATACPLDLQNLSWSLTGGTTNKYDSTAKTFTGTAFEAVTLNGTTVTVANNVGNGHMTALWSLANVKPTVTVSVNEDVSVSAPIEWVYRDIVFDIDVDTYAPAKAEKYVAYENGESGNKVLSFPVSSGFQTFFTQEMMLKPNSRYVMSFRSKTPSGTSAVIDAQIGTWVDITDFNTTNKAVLESVSSTQDWITNTVLIQTGDSPATDRDYSLMLERKSGSGTNPVLIDDLKLQLVSEDTGVILGGDFEFSAPTVAYYDQIIRNGFGEIVQGDAALGNTSKVLKLKAGVGRGSNTAVMGLRYLVPNTAYKVTFRHKGGAVLFNVSGGDGWAATINNVGATSNFAAAEEWTTRTVYFVSGSAITNSGNWTSSMQFGTPNATEAVYLDDIVFTEMEAAPFVKAVKSAADRPGTLSLSAGSSSGKLITTAKAGSTVRVTAKPNSGYVLKPGSLHYTTTDGKTVKILNKSMTAVNFGNGDGTVYEFVMPEGSVGISAEFISTADTSFAVDTIGTSLRATGDGGYDGIRFLTRMYFAGGFDGDNNALTVKYNGATYDVLEIGALLKRAENTTALTVENAEAALSATGANRMWKSVAYTKDGDYRLVDYTASYIDFAVVMLRGSNLSEEAFYARSYTSRGYMKLQAADGTIVTVECDTELTNSISSVIPIL